MHMNGAGIFAANVRLIHISRIRKDEQRLCNIFTYRAVQSDSITLQCLTLNRSIIQYQLASKLLQLSHYIVSLL